MHSPFRHTALPQTTTPWLAAQGHVLTDDWSLPVLISLTACAHFAARLVSFFYRTRFIWQQCTVRQYHSNLSDQSALEIRVGIRVRLKVALAFSRRIRKVSILSSANFTDGNILLTERPHTITITYSKSARAYIRQLANYSAFALTNLLT